MAGRKKKELVVSDDYDGSKPLKSVMQELVISNLLQGLPDGEAYSGAGYKAKNPSNGLNQLRKNKDFQIRLAFRRGELKKALGITEEDINRGLAQIAFSDPAEAYEKDGTLKPIHEMPLNIRQTIAGIDVEELFEGRGEERECVGHVKKIRFCNRNNALEQLGKHIGYFERDNDQRRQQVQINVVYFSNNGDGNNTTPQLQPA